MIDIDDLALRAWANVIKRAYGFEPFPMPVPVIPDHGDERDFAVELIRLTLEEAAKRCDAIRAENPTFDLPPEQCAAAIRRMKP